MEEVLAIVAIFIALPWIILHYVTRWKTSATITSDDEALLEELYSLAKRLEEPEAHRPRDPRPHARHRSPPGRCRNRLRLVQSAPDR